MSIDDINDEEKDSPEKVAYDLGFNLHFPKQQKKEQTEKSFIQPDVRQKYEIQVLKLRKENPNLTFEQWSSRLLELRMKINEKIDESFPSIKLTLDFALAIKTILNIEDITLPFMGIVFGAPSSLKTQVFELLRGFWYSYYSDKFTARAFVSHSANTTKDKLSEIDMLPRIRFKIVITPELSALFTGKDDDIREQFGIITRVLDGKGLETDSGVHGKRGYTGDYMFTWIGAAVTIPYSVYKFLSTIGFKIYFLRLPRIEVTEDDLVEQLTSKKKFSDKMKEIEKLLYDYLMWFEICPISIGQNGVARVKWNHEKDDKNSIKIISRLAILLAHLRGHVYVYKSSDHSDDGVQFEPTSNTIEIKSYNHELPTIEHPSRAAQQLYNLARGHALSYGRNYITKDDISLIIKVVLSTSSLERVIIFDLLIANNGRLTTSQITNSLNITKERAKKTMTEFKGLDLVTIMDGNENNSEYMIKLNSKFDWFLTNEFSELRNGFKPTEVKESCYAKNIPCASDNNNSNCYEKNRQLEEVSSINNNESNQEDCNNNDNNSLKGKNSHSKIEDDTVIKGFKLSISPKSDIHFINYKESNTFSEKDE